MPERFDKKFTYISSGFLGNEDYISLIEVKINDLKSFIQSEIDLAVAKKEKEIVGEIRQKTLDSWHEAQTLRMNKDGSVSPDVDLNLMGKILLKKIT